MASSFRSCSWAIFDDATSPQPPTKMPHRRGSLDDQLQPLRLTTPYFFVYFPVRPIPPNIAASSSIHSRSLSYLLPSLRAKPSVSRKLFSPAIPVPHLPPHRVREHAPTSKASLSVATRIQLTHQTTGGSVYERPQCRRSYQRPPHSKARSNVRYERNSQHRTHVRPHTNILHWFAVSSIVALA